MKLEWSDSVTYVSGCSDYYGQDHDQKRGEGPYEGFVDEAYEGGLKVLSRDPATGDYEYYHVLDQDVL